METHRNWAQLSNSVFNSAISHWAYVCWLEWWAELFAPIRMAYPLQSEWPIHYVICILCSMCDCHMIVYWVLSMCLDPGLNPLQVWYHFIIWRTQGLDSFLDWGCWISTKWNHLLKEIVSKLAWTRVWLPPKLVCHELSLWAGYW